MNKRLTLAAAALLALGLTACEQNTYEAAPASNPEPASAPVERDEPNVQLEIEGDDGSLKINSD